MTNGPASTNAMCDGQGDAALGTTPSEHGIAIMRTSAVRRSLADRLTSVRELAPLRGAPPISVMPCPGVRLVPAARRCGPGSMRRHTNHTCRRSRARAVHMRGTAVRVARRTTRRIVLTHGSGAHMRGTAATGRTPALARNRRPATFFCATSSFSQPRRPRGYSRGRGHTMRSPEDASHPRNSGMRPHLRPDPGRQASR
jgi:hypothetical protein